MNYKFFCASYAYVHCYCFPFISLSLHFHNKIRKRKEARQKKQEEMVDKQPPPPLQTAKSDWLLSEMQDVCTTLFREIAKAMAYKNLDHKLKHEYPFVVHHFTGGVQ